MHKVAHDTVFIKGIYTSGNSRMAELVRPNIQKKIADTCLSMRWYYACKVRKGTVFIKGIYTSGNSRMAETGSPEHPKENSRYDAYMRWYYACKVRKGTVFIKGIYISANSRMAGHWFARTSTKKIADVRTWDDIMHKVHNGYCIYQRNLYFRELTHGRTGSPEHPKENSRYVRPWDDIMHVSTQRYCIYQRNLYFRELTHGRDWFVRTSKRK